MSAKVLVNCTVGKENPERASLAFVVGNVAATADQETIVLLTIEGVRLATVGYVDGIQQAGFQPLKDIIQSFVGNGGEIWVCGSSRKPPGGTRPRPFSRQRGGHPRAPRRPPGGGGA